MDQNFNENQNNKMINESQNSQVSEEKPNPNVKVDGTNLQNAIRHFEKNMYKPSQDIEYDMYNKLGIPPKKRR